MKIQLEVFLSIIRIHKENFVIKIFEKNRNTECNAKIKFFFRNRFK